MTDFLFARPSFLSGMARVLDLGATFDTYNRSPTGKDADNIAIYNDFKAVGDDLRRALRQEMGKGKEAENLAAHAV
jgi:hypothetical protein